MTALSIAIRTSLLIGVVGGEALVILAAAAVFLGHGIATGLASRRNLRRRSAGSTRLRLLLDEARDGSGEGGSQIHALASLPRRMQIDLLTALAPSLGGSQRARLSWVATEMGVAALAEARCGSRLWWRRLRGARLCTLLGAGARSVPPLLHDPRPEVRAQAAEWVVEYHDDDLVQALLAMLDLDEGSTRFAVMDSLIRIGGPLTKPLAEHLAAVHGSSLGPALEVAAALPDATMLPAALALCRDDAGHIRALAAGLAGAIGGPAAFAALEALLGDQQAEVRAAAARALGKAGHWPAAPSLAGLLGDPGWGVRQEAATALRLLGSPGVLYLRRALRSEDPFAAQVAQQVLELPESAVRTI